MQRVLPRSDWRYSLPVRYINYRALTGAHLTLNVAHLLVLFHYKKGISKDCGLS